MYAVVEGLNQDQEFDWSACNGDRIEVLGFVHVDRETWAVWRHDDGGLDEIPTGYIRMDPATVKVEVP